MTDLHLIPLENLCVVCGKVFSQTPRPHGGGRKTLYCSKKCCQRRYLLKNPEKRKATILKYESVEENKTRKIKQARVRRLKNKYGWTDEDFSKELQRQNYSCYGCLARIDEKTAKVDHDHDVSSPHARGLLCDLCNRGLGYLKENPATLRRLMAYLDHDRTKKNIYLIGALKNKRVPEVGNLLRKSGYDVMDEWFTPGEFADSNWQEYEKQRGRTYSEALRGRAATNIFLFDRSYLDLSDIVILVSPAGKSAMIELGYAKGRGKKTIIFLDGQDPDRYDIMPNFADDVVFSEQELLDKLTSL